MKYLFLLLTLSTIFLNTAIAQELGVNFNETISYAKDPQTISRTETTWVRGFLDFFEYMENPKKLTDPKGDLAAFLNLQKHGFKTILSLKFRFRKATIPYPTSEEAQVYLDFLSEILDHVWGKIDIIVIGNEPYIESKREEWDTKLPAFYKSLCIHTHNYGKGKTALPIYFGAFNKLYEQDWQTQGVDEMLDFVRQESWLSGVNIHIHHSSNDQISSIYNYVDERIRRDQKVLITEFSLVHWWKTNNLDSIPGEFAKSYGYPKHQKVHEYILFALNNPRPKQEWDDFLKNSPWFEERKNYLTEAYEIFKSYESFHVATYPYRIKWGKNYSSTSMPWLINNLIAGVTVKANPKTGEDQFNYHFIEDFKEIQSKVEK
ncbi:MAG: hypothetical protein AAF944_09720 [Bacteroidota bacterium]